MRLTKRGKKRLVIVSAVGGVGAILVASGLLYYPIYKDRLAREARADGLALYEKGDYEAALPKLNFYVSRLGQYDDPETLAIFADTRRKVPAPNGRHLLAAIAQYQHARTLDPENRAALEGLLALYRETGRRAELNEIADAMLELEPDHIGALEAKAGALRGLGRFNQALEAAKRLVQLSPLSFSYRVLVLDLSRQDGADDDALVAICDQWIADEPVDDGRLLLIKAITLATVDRVTESQELMREAAARGAGEGVLPIMVDWLERLDMRDEARELIARSRETYRGQQWFHQFMIEREWRGGRFANAQQELAESAELIDGSDPRILRLAALLHVFSGNKEEAGRAVEALERAANAARAEDRDRYRGWASALRARLERAGEDWAGAITAYEEAQSLAPDDEIIHYLLGEALAEVGESERAALHFERAFPENSTWVAAGAAYVETLNSLGRYEDAYLAGQDLIVRTSPQVLEPWLLWFEAWLALEEAGIGAPEDRGTGAEEGRLVRVLEDFYTQSEQEESVALLLARAYRAQGAPERAVELARESLEREDVSAGFLVQMATVFSADDRDTARELLRRAEEVEGVTPALAMVRASMMASEGSPEAGLALLDDALEGSELSEMERLRARLRYLSRVQLPELREALREVVGRDDAEPADLIGILSIDETWKDEELINRTIERLRGQLGEHSVRVELAEAGRTLHFAADDAEAVSAAIISMDGVLRRLPDSLPGRTLMAGLLLVGDRPDEREAARHLRAAIDRYPSQVSLYPQLIELLQKQRDFNAAGHYLSLLSAQQHNPSEQMQRTELTLLHQQGNFDAAINKLSGLMNDESSETDRILMASLLLKAGRVDEARRQVEDALKRFGSNWMTLRFASHFYASQGQLDRAVSLLRDSNVEGGEATRALLLGSFYHEQGYHEEAGQWLQRAVEVDPGNLNGWALLAQHHLALGDYEPARQAALKGLEQDPDDESLRVALASIGLADPNPESRRKAIEVFRQLRGDNEALIDTMELLDQALGEDGSLRAAPELLNPARALAQEHSGFLPAWRLAVLLHAQSNRRVDAVNLAREAMVKLPTAAEPVMWAVDLLSENRQYRDALDMAQEWRRRSLEDPIDADIMIARLQLSLRDASPAMQTLSPHAVRIEQEKEWAATRGQQEQMQSLGRFELWLRTLILNEQFQRALALVRPDPDPIRWVQAWLTTIPLLEDAAARQALLAIEPVAIQDPAKTIDLATAWVMLGRQTQNASDFDKADQLSVSVLDQESVRVYAMLFRAELSDARGEHEEAISLYRSVLDESPQNQVALNNVAYLLGPRLHRYDEAVSYSARVVAAHPDIPDFLDTHALVLLGLNRTREAEETARAAQRLRPEDPGILLTLSSVLLKSGGSTVEARQMLERARDLLNAAPVRNRHLEERLAALEQELSSGT